MKIVGEKVVRVVCDTHGTRLGLIEGRVTDLVLNEMRGSTHRSCHLSIEDTVLTLTHAEELEKDGFGFLLFTQARHRPLYRK